MTLTRMQRIAALIAVAALCMASSATLADPPVIPGDAMGYYRLDPTGFDKQGATLLPVALNFAERIGLVEAEFRPIFDGVLAASVAGAVAHTLCLLDLDAEFDDAAPHGYRIDSLSAVLVLESANNHRTFLSTLETIVSHIDAGGAMPELFELPGGQRGARLKAPEWDDWRAVEWASVPGAFLVGIGQGTLDRWMRVQADAGTSAEVQAHRQAVAEGADAFLEVFLNLEQAHVRMPEVLAQGRTRRWLTTWRLDGARSWMFHGRWSDRFLVADVTWQRVGLEPDRVYQRSLTRDTWPGDLTLPMPQGRYVVVIPIDFRAAFDRVLEARRATISDSKLVAFDAQVRRYRAKQKHVYDAIWSAFKPYVIMSNDPAPPVAIPGATTVFFELRDAKDARPTQARLESLLEQFMELPDVKRLGESVVHRDDRQNVYWLQLESSGTLRVPTWGWAGQYLIGGWGPSVVTAHRERLKAQRRR